ncbi:hypothetical protein LXT21_06400 [Myxococcus sp. K38C18041901]|uniref:hypothetical protein n=1 Tax=Myxococcus guangdongensis TaxID=2906760 RepID=UPI0020A8182A|nr:hypothetical protein [Myxococcus guangdongensis]MCP3058394.1 hypothetical protein [Myxococcus guangdongensis]
MARTGTHGRRRLGAAMVAALGLLAPQALAEEPRVACTATLSGRRVLVRPEAFAFLSEELDRLVRLGMAGKLEVELSLWKRRTLWFNTRLDGARLTQVIGFGRDGYLLDGRLLAQGPAALELDRVAWTLESRADTGDRFIVQVEVRLNVVTAASLGRMASWLRWKDEEGEGGRTSLTGTLLRSVAEDLTRRASGRCDVAPPT